MSASPENSSAIDWTHARCDVYPKGSDHTDVVIPCVFSQRQGYITIDRSDGVTHDLSPKGDLPGNFRDQHGRAVYRNSGLGKRGQIFRFPDEAVYVYWDVAGLPGTNDADNYTAPYTTADFDATSRVDCVLSGQETSGKGDCAAGIRRGPQAGQAAVTIMRPDGVERVLRFDGDQVASPGGGKIDASDATGDWIISIDGTERYRFPVEFLVGD